MKNMIAKIAELTGWCTLGCLAFLALCMVIPGGFVLLGVIIASDKLERWSDKNAST